VNEFHVGDEVARDGRTYVVRGISPMSATPRRLLLEDRESGALVELPLGEIEPTSDEEEST
jgi:hypothetical protein